MHFAVLERVMDRIASDPDLNAYLAEQFPGSTPFYTIGLKPDDETGTSVPADCFPYVAVSPLTETIAENSQKAEASVSIMYGVNNDARDGRLFVGLQQVSAVGLLIYRALKKQAIGTQPAVAWNGKAQIRSDAGLQHPYYEGEIIIPLQVRT